MRPSLPPRSEATPAYARARSVRSFVVRAGRTTEAQRRALSELWPRFGVDFAPRRLDLDALYGRHAPRVVEIGFGNGEHLVDLAMRYADRNYLGIDVHPPGVGRLLLALAESGLENVRVSCHDAVEVFEAQIPPGSLEEVQILFPDPWPKKRHHKRRLIQAGFAACLADRLSPGGLLRLATDWEPYAHQMLQVLTACELLQNLAPGASFAEQSSDRLPTHFEERGRRLGHEVWELAFRKREAATG